VTEPEEAAEPKPDEPAEPDGDAPPEPAKVDDDETGDAVFEALWTRVIEAWDDDKPHQAALSHALDRQLLPVIAGRYRKLLDEPSKAERAKKRIDAIVLTATQLMLATKTPPREKVPWQWTASLAVIFVLVMAFLVYQLFIPHHR